MSVRLYRENRAKIPPEELTRHKGQWVAFSQDGARIVASAKTLETLDNRIVAAGENPEMVVLEYIGAEDIVVGGAEFL
jgi:hypothetical protein